MKPTFAAILGLITLWLASFVSAQHYSMTQIAFSANDYSGTGVFGGGVDDSYTSLSLPFTFNFYGSPQDTVIVSSNGFLQFPNCACISNGCCDAHPVTADTCPHGYIAGQWTDMSTSSDFQIAYRTDGVAPNRQFIISYQLDYCCGSPGTSNKYQFRLQETSNIIEVHYESLQSGDIISAGIQHPTERAGNQFYFGNGIPELPTAVRYTPNAGSFPSISGTVDVSPADGVVTVSTPLRLSFRISDSDTPQVDVHIYWGDGEVTVQSNQPRNTLLSYTHIYNSVGDYCVAICLDDAGTSQCSFYADYDPGCAGGNEEFPPSKRSISSSNVVVSVLASVGGDPYFYGFDGKVFKFVGEIRHVYNLISSPTLQVNALMDKGRSSSGDYSMASVIRQVGIMWNKLDNYAKFAIDQYGNMDLEVQSQGFAVALGDEEQTLSLGAEHSGGVTLHWQPSTNYTRENAALHLSPHQVLHQLSIRNSYFIVELFAVSLPFQSGNTEFFFVDMQARLRVHSGECFEGVWGRTSCQSSMDKFDQFSYDLHGDILGYDFPANLYVVN